MKEVPFNRNTYNRCLCGGCPVNRKSKCSAIKETKLAPLTGRIEKEGRMPDPKATPGIYCATGMSDCDDMDNSSVCLCPACSVEMVYDLDKNYFCLTGSAAEAEK